MGHIRSINAKARRLASWDSSVRFSLLDRPGLGRSPASSCRAGQTWRRRLTGRLGAAQGDHEALAGGDNIAGLAWFVRKGEVIAITAETATIQKPSGAGQTFYRRPGDSKRG